MWGLVPLLRTRGYSPLPVHFLGKAATFNLLYAFPLLLLGDGDGTVARLGRGVRLGVRDLGRRPLLVGGGALRLPGVPAARHHGASAGPVMTDVGERARTPLLELVTRESLDLDYEDVARRRADPGRTTGPTPHRGAAVAVGVFGLLVAVAAVQNSRNADADQASRDAPA